METYQNISRPRKPANAESSAGRRHGFGCRPETESRPATQHPSHAQHASAARRSSTHDARLISAVCECRRSVRPAAGSRSMQRQNSPDRVNLLSPSGNAKRKHVALGWKMNGAGDRMCHASTRPVEGVSREGLSMRGRSRHPHIQAARCRAAISLSVSQPQRPTGHRPGSAAGALNVFQEPPADGDSSPASGRQAAGGNALLWGPAIAHGQSESGKPGWRGSEPS